MKHENMYFIVSFRMSIKVGTRVEVVGKGVVGTVAYIGAMGYHL